MEVDTMGDYQTLSEILVLPENEGLTQYAVFRKPFEKSVDDRVIQEHYHSFLREYKSDTNKFDPIHLWTHEQQNLMMYKMKGDRK